MALVVKQRQTEVKKTLPLLAVAEGKSLAFRNECYLLMHKNVLPDFPGKYSHHATDNFTSNII